FDLNTLLRVGSLKFGANPYALSWGVDGHMIVVTNLGVLDFDVTTRTAKILLKGVDVHAQVCTDRSAKATYVADTVNGHVVVTRIDLANPSNPPTTSPANAIAGSPIGMTLSYHEDELLVGTNGDDGIVVLDATTLTVKSSLALGPGLAAVATNPTG